MEAALGQPCPARPGKVVAGLEPEQTNQLLQMLAAAARTHAAGGASATATPAAAMPAAAPASASRYAPAAEDRAGADDGEGAPVVFARPKLDALLPALARRVAEARAARGGGGPDAGATLQQVDQVAGIALDASVLARCLEALRGSAAAIAAEGAAWAREADKLEARVAEEERAEAAAATVAQARLAALDAQMDGARRRLAAAGVRA